MTMESLTGSDVDREGLSDVKETFYFTDSKDLGQAIRSFFNDAFDRDSLCDHTILVKGFPPKDLVNDDEALIPGKYKILCLEDPQSLLLTMVSLPHEVAAGEFGLVMHSKLEAMNIADKYRERTDDKRDDRRPKNA